MAVARYMVQGVDVWLNVPRRWQEASGSSGMKAALNGVLNLSVLDGWWREGYNTGNGWAVGSLDTAATPEEENKSDADALYRLLENEIVPLYYDRDVQGIPRRWVTMMKEAMRSIVPAFCARRMMKDYIEELYRPAIERS